MEYVSLKKIHYKQPDIEEEVYQCRFHSDLTRHLSLDIKQYNHKRAYPAFLCYTENMLLLQEKINKKYEEFLYIVNTVPPVVLRQFSLVCIVDEVKSTNDIEGVKSTRREISMVLDEGLSADNRMSSVVHKYQSLLSKDDIPFFTCQDIRNFYDSFAHEEVIKEDPRNKLDGKIFRHGSVDIASVTGKTIHRGLYPESAITSALTQALAILHDENMPILSRVSVFHYLFAYIHPFYDGNGRTDRFITAYFLARHFHPLVAIRLSVTIKRYRKKYYTLFEDTDSELNRADLTTFVEGFWSLLLISFEDTIRLLSRKKEQLERFEKKLSELYSGDKLTENIYYILLQAALFYGQGVTMQDLMSVTQKSRATIQKRLDSIPDAHLAKSKIKNVYYYKLNLLILKTEGT